MKRFFLFFCCDTRRCFTFPCHRNSLLNVTTSGQEKKQTDVKLHDYKIVHIQITLQEVYLLWKASGEATILDITDSAEEIQYIDISLMVGKINQVKLPKKANLKHVAANLEN